MKGRTAMVAGGVLLLVLGLAANWYRLTARPQRISVRFVAYEASGGHEWAAIFRATNDTLTSVTCDPSVQQKSGGLRLLLPAPVILAPKSGVTWLCPVADTNSVRCLEIECFAQISPLKQRLADWTTRYWTNHSPFYVLMGRADRYNVICPTDTQPAH
jgi:hypothetical protein